MKLLNTSTRSLLSCDVPGALRARARRPRQSSETERYERRCLSQTPTRGNHPQGTMLWGTRRSVALAGREHESRSVVVSVDLTAPLKTDSPRRGPAAGGRAAGGLAGLLH